MCRKERGCFPGWSAFRGQGGRKRCAPGRCAVGPGGVAVWPWFPTPHTGQSERESSLIGSLAVSFTLNIKVKQTSQASLCWQRRGEPSPAESGVLGPWSSMSGDSFPSLPLPPGPLATQSCLRAASNTETQVLCGSSRSPLCWPSPGTGLHHPHSDSTSAKANE